MSSEMDTGITAFMANGDGKTLPHITLEKPDPFNPERLRLNQNFGSNLGVEKALLEVPVCKPEDHWWFRVNPDIDQHLPVIVLEWKEDQEFYIVAPALQNALTTEPTCSRRTLYPAINSLGVVFLWPIRLPGPKRRLDKWNKSAREAVAMAMKGWIRLVPNGSLGAYEARTTTVNKPDPQWFNLPIGDLLKVAFKDNHIDSLNHPILKKLRGEM